MEGSFGSRAFAAFRLGVAVSAAGAAVLGGLALARGPDMNLPIFGAASSPAPAAASFSPAPETAARPAARASDDEDRPSRRAKRASVKTSGGRYLRYGNAVCVRLCDGSFFPAADPSGGDAACEAQCPDAPVALYAMPSDDIDSAVSLTGASYKALPVAGRYRTTFDNTCACRRSATLPQAAWKKDRTLRKDDVVSTPHGFVVYAGGADFVALAKASGLGRERQADLAAMERVSTSSGAAAGRHGAVTVSDASPR